MTMREIPLSQSDYRRFDHEYECPRCDREWARCTCPMPDPAIAKARADAARARLLGR